MQIYNVISPHTDFGTLTVFGLSLWRNPWRFYIIPYDSVFLWEWIPSRNVFFLSLKLLTIHRTLQFFNLLMQCHLIIPLFIPSQCRNNCQVWIWPLNVCLGWIKWGSASGLDRTLSVENIAVWSNYVRRQSNDISANSVNVQNPYRSFFQMVLCDNYYYFFICLQNKKNKQQIISKNIAC